jgi:hypothetical protein
MTFVSGWFHDTKHHHKGWFRVFNFTHTTEVWFGHRWYFIDWRIN